MASRPTDPHQPTAAPALLALVPTQHDGRRSALVEADDTRLDDLLGHGPVRLATLVAAALPALGLVPQR